jgi:hypothetical protein
MKLSLILLAVVACGGSAPPPATATTTTQLPVPTATATPTVTASASTAVPVAGAPNRPTELPGTPIRFLGGDGTSVDTAILIQGAHGEMDGTASEYRYLAMVYGRQNDAWKLEQQSLLNHAGKQYDAMAIVLVATGTKKTVYFDITDYFGKM